MRSLQRARQDLSSVVLHKPWPRKVLSDVTIAAPGDHTVAPHHQTSGARGAFIYGKDVMHEAESTATATRTSTTTPTAISFGFAVDARTGLRRSPAAGLIQRLIQQVHPQLMQPAIICSPDYEHQHAI